MPSWRCSDTAVLLLLLMMMMMMLVVGLSSAQRAGHEKFCSDNIDCQPNLVCRNRVCVCDNGYYWSANTSLLVGCRSIGSDYKPAITRFSVKAYSIEVTWRIIETCCINLHYLLRYQLQAWETKNPDKKQPVRLVTETTRKMEGLSSNTKYTVRLVSVVMYGAEETHSDPAVTELKTSFALDFLNRSYSAATYAIIAFSCLLVIIVICIIIYTIFYIKQSRTAILEGLARRSAVQSRAPSVSNKSVGLRRKSFDVTSKVSSRKGDPVPQTLG